MEKERVKDPLFEEHQYVRQQQQQQQQQKQLPNSKITQRLLGPRSPSSSLISALIL
jgi:hypothetical protein